jgi:predicted RNase H-like HicB family nuclease
MRKLLKKYQEFDINYFQDEVGMFTAQMPAIRECVASGKTLEKTCQQSA